MFTHHKKKLLILAALVVFALTTGIGCKGGSLEAQRALETDITLNIWGVFDSQDAYNDLIERYQETRPYIIIKYRKLQFAEYERALLEAWAENRGPDIFLVHNTWVGGYVNKIQPPPENIRLATAVITGDLKKKVDASITEYRPITLPEVRNDFVSAVATDVFRNNQLYGLPLSVDTMVLYYNRALLDQAGIAAVPRTWQDVKEASKKLTLLDDQNITRSGVALGGAANINRSFDILSLLMAQNGTQFLAAGGGRSMIAQASPYSTDTSYKPGQEALRFYTDFASPTKEVYTWSESLPSAQERFTSGNLAMMLGYNYQLPLLRVQGPRVDLGIAPAPHINSDGTDATGNTINWANYWLLSVANSTEHINEAWDFIHFATTKPDNARLYTQKTNKPTALRSVIAQQLQNPELAVFANQLLTAQSWYTGMDAQAAETIFRDMIQSVVANKSSITDAIKRAENAISQTLR
jgi:multiple sugar transport system substrate-binding protein